MHISKLRVVFMGTPEFAVHILDGLLENKINVVGVITAPDRPSGRGLKLNQSAVKNYASSKNLNILQPKNLKDPSFIQKLKQLRIDLNIVVAFRMLPKTVWDLPLLGTFNLHASLLPNYRGAAPINWVLINGEKETGVTTFFIDENIDTGKIILQEKIAIGSQENAGQLHDRLMHLGQKLVLKTINCIIGGNLDSLSQKDSPKLKTAYKLHKNNCKINWYLPAESIFNLVRGLSPYPSAWAELLNGNQLYNIKIDKVSIEYKEHQHQTGLILSSKKEIKIAVKEGYIKLIRFKFPGKKYMNATSFLNGFKFDSAAKMQ